MKLGSASMPQHRWATEPDYAAHFNQKAGVQRKVAYARFVLAAAVFAG
jgi:hypothetical protein